MASSSPHSATSAIMNPASKASPHSKITIPRSTTRITTTEQDLGLSRIIGTTTTSNNAFDVLQDQHSIGYIAGAVAVVAKVAVDGSLSQRFFRAKQSTNAGCYAVPLGELSSNPLSPSQGLRNRAPVRHRDSPTSPSAFGSSIFSSLDSPGGRNGTSIVDKIKSLTCLSFSPDGKYLAAGETGHKPRVLIFPLDQVSQHDPLWTSLSEHTFGIRCLAFSPDSQLLASLGDINDGFLHIWSVNPRTGTFTLRASNKCTTTVNHMAWIGKNLITVGTRHVKVWNVESTLSQDGGGKSLADQMSTLNLDGPRTLLGRNCLLGSMLDKTFSAIVPLTSSRAVVCSENGDICIFDDNESSSQLVWVGDAGFPLQTASLLSTIMLVVAGQSGKMRIFGLAKFLSGPLTEDRKTYERGIAIKAGQTANSIVALGFLGDAVVLLDSNKTIQVLSCNPEVITESVDHTLRISPAHASAPVGVQSLQRPNVLDAAFMTWALDGSVFLWSHEGCIKRQIKLTLGSDQTSTEEMVNELKVVRLSTDNTHLITGDRYGILRYDLLGRRAISSAN